MSENEALGGSDEDFILLPKQKANKAHEHAENAYVAVRTSGLLLKLIVAGKIITGNTSSYGTLRTAQSPVVLHGRHFMKERIVPTTSMKLLRTLLPPIWV